MGELQVAKFITGLTAMGFVAAILGAGAAAPGVALAASTFQGTCSNIQFAYSGNNPTITAVCLRANGTPNATSLTLTGIGNSNGNLVSTGGPATFQQSCGNITVAVVNTSTVTLNAYCRTGGGASNPTSYTLNGIGNNNGNLSQ
jgi:hypothetical protein